MKKIIKEDPLYTIYIKDVPAGASIIALNDGNEIQGFVNRDLAGVQLITSLYNNTDATYFKDLKSLMDFFTHLTFYVI